MSYLKMKAQPLEIKKEKEDLQTKIETLVTTAKRHLETTQSELNDQILVLIDLRKSIYENLNQLPHKALLIEAAEYLQEKYPEINTWTWHPEQTSHPNEADLMGDIDKIYAEATTSLLPVGAIGTKMKNTLVKLDELRREQQAKNFISLNQRKCLKMQKNNL